MQYKKIKAPGEIKIKGVNVVFEKNESGYIECVYLMFDGRRIRLRGTDNYNKCVEISEMVPETAKKWRLKGRVLGMLVEEYFDDQYDGKQRMSKLQAAQESDEDPLSLEEVDVEIDSEGNVVVETKGAALGDGVPF